MKKFLLMIIAAVGMMVAYQSANDKVNAGHPIIEIDLPCLYVPNEYCEYEYEIGEYQYYDIMEGRIYKSNN